MTNNPLGMKSIKENMNVPIAETFKIGLGSDWVFDKVYEKIILFLAMSWGVYSVVAFLWRLFI